MNRLRIPPMVTALLALTSAGCVYQEFDPDARLRAIESCEGLVVLDIRNNTDQQMEIVESRSGSGARTVVAIVSPGVSEVMVRRERDYHYSARPYRGAATVSLEGRQRPRDRAVTMRRVCKPVRD